MTPALSRAASPRARRITDRRWMAALAVAAGAGGCYAAARGFDSSWGPVVSPQQFAAMAPTLAPDPDNVLDLPRFAVAQAVMPSGLRVGVEPGRARGLVAVVAVVGSGASADPPAREGLAHLVEHLVFHAHSRRERTESERLLRVGAAYNADTSLDATRFYEAAPADALPALLDITAERLSRPLAGVDEADLERERAIVENELYQRNETGVYGRVVAWMQHALFPPGHPYARPIGGSPATLRALTLADARAFAAAHYRPDNATLLVTGEIGAGALAGVVARLPDAIKKGASGGPARNALAPATVGGGAAASGVAPAPGPGAAGPPAAPETLRAAVATPEIWLAYDLGPSSAQPGAVGRILTTAAAEAAVREHLIVEPEVLAVEFHAFELRDRMLLGCQIVLEHSRRRDWLAQTAQNLIWALWSDAGPPTAVEWVDWRQGTVFNLQHAAVNSAVLESEPFLERATSRARSFQITGAVDAFDRLLWTIAATRTSDVSNVAFRALAPERARTLFLEPVVGEVQRPGPVGVASPENLPLDASPFRAADFGAPPPAPAPPGLREARIFPLPNGLTVVLVPRPGFPAVTALLGFHGGAAAIFPGVLTLVRAAEAGGTGQRGAAALRTERADGPGYTADVVRTDRRHLSNALYLLADRVHDVAGTDWAGVLERARPRLASMPAPIDEPRAQASAKVRAALYGSHAYGTRAGLDNLRVLDPSLAPVWLPQLYGPRNAVLVVAGDMDVAAATRIVAGWFSDWHGPASARRLNVPWVPPPLRAQKREELLITHRPVGAQVEVTLACRLPYPKTARERAAQRIAASVLGGYLTNEIREQAGAAYSIDSTAFLAPGGAAHIETAMSVDSRRLREVLRVLHAQIDLLARGDVDKAALSQVQWALTRGAALRFQTASELAEEIMETITLGLPIDTVTGDVDELARVTPPDVHRVFAACNEGTVLSLVGDDATIRGAL